MKNPMYMNEQQALFLNSAYYCKDPEGLRFVLTGLRRLGYVITGARFTEPRPTVPPNEFERRCVPMWDAVLPGVRMAQCLSCEGVIDPTDVDCDEGRPCEFCGTQTMLPSKVPGAQNVLTWNFKFILYWCGKVYPDKQEGRKGLQLPIHVRVYEAWQWAPLPCGPELAHHVLWQVGRIRVDGQYDDRDVCRDMHQRLNDMRLFVRDFTVIPIETWRSAAFGLKQVARPQRVREVLLPVLTG